MGLRHNTGLLTLIRFSYSALSGFHLALFTFVAPGYLFLRNRCVITGDHHADGVSGCIDDGGY